MSQQGGKRAPDGPAEPRAKRSRFDTPAVSNGKSESAAGKLRADGKAVTDRAAALERAKKALQLKDLHSNLQTKLAALKAKLPPPATGVGSAPRPAAAALTPRLGGVGLGERHTLRLDDQGREVDEFGNVVKRSTAAISTLKVNQKKVDPKPAPSIPAAPTGPTNEDFFDPYIGNREVKRLERRQCAGFDFVQQGRLQKQAEGQRLRAQYGSEAFKPKASRAAEDDVDPNSIVVDVNAIPLGTRAGLPVPEQVPDVEWWDCVLLPGDKGEQHYAVTTSDGVEVPVFKDEAITMYVQHPVPIEPPAEEQAPAAMPLLLTKKEHRKLRKQRREETEKEKQELMRQGLLEPPKPKVKLSNMMRVLGGEAVADPTALEAQIKAQMLERQQAHEDRNEARKLTPAERKQKHIQKLTGVDDEAAVTVTVYAILDLSSTQHQWKVRVNAEELHMKGCAVISPKMAVVVVEGSAKGHKKYSKLIMQRIAWNAGREDDEGAGDRPPNKAMQAWSGVVAKPAFPDRFLVVSCKNEIAARLALEEHGVGHYWDVANAAAQE